MTFSRVSRFWMLLSVLCGMLSIACAVAVPTIRADDSATPNGSVLKVSDLVALAELSNAHFTAVPDAAVLNVDKVTAFEENERFVFLAGTSETVVRRVLFLKPNTFIVEDWSSSPATRASSQWALWSPNILTLDGRRFIARSPMGNLIGETVLPTKAIPQVVPTHDGEKLSGYVVKADSDGPAVDRRLLVLHLVRPGEQDDDPRYEVTNAAAGRVLTVTQKKQTLELSLPAEKDAVGTIAIRAADDQSVLQERFLPSSIMPYGEEGIRLIQRWDTPYHGDRRPGWDTGRVAPELKKLVESQPDRRGRAVVLGCGTGTNAIYLADQGFEVTGVDVAPTALARAQKKARETGVTIHWVLADVLSLPELKPVDLIFDRGCYHHVRQYNAAGYVQSTCRLAHPGTRILLLAGSAKEQRPGGPPKIKEAEIRDDFAKSFVIEWFREIRFDSVNPNAQGPLAWSVLMERRESD